MNKGEIYLIGIPQSNGHEQVGFRPGIILSNKIKDIVMIVPLTTQPKANNYEFTLKIPKSSQNGLKSDSIALVFQLRAIDKKRIKEKIGILENDLLNKLNNLIIDMLNLK